MQIFFWLALFMLCGVSIFAVQNSDASKVMIKFLFWKFETSLVYTILGSIGLGIFLTLLIWIPKAIQSSFQKQKLPKEIEQPKIKNQTSPPPSSIS